MNKKVGILTFQDTANFGSALQTYALWKTVNDLGYDCEIINYICEKINLKEVPRLSKCKNLKEIICFLLYGKYNIKKHKNIIKFLKQYSMLSEKEYNRNNVKETNDLYSKFLIGSDLVWYIKSTDDYSYFLDFVSDDIKKIAYGPSIGDPYDDDEKRKLKPLLKSFQKITVREKQAKEWIKELYDGDVYVVCDPTMLLSADDWSIFVGNRIVKEKYVLVYFDDKEGKCLNDAIEYAKNNGFKVYFIHYGKKKKNVNSVKPTTINEFLNLFFYAEHTFIASYHGLLFSIYFNKNFLFYNNTGKSRMSSIAEILEINKHDGKKTDIKKYSPEFNWKKINKNVIEFRQKSIKILADMLGDNDV